LIGRTAIDLSRWQSGPDICVPLPPAPPPVPKSMLGLTLGTARGPAPLPHETIQGSVYGWRSWRIEERDAGVYVLTSPYQDHEWPGPVMHAHCRCGLTYNDGKYFDATCDGRCGIYAHKTPREAVEAALRDNWAVGRVEMWGEGYEAEDGYRMEWARIRLLIVGPGSTDLEPFVNRYRCPVKIVPERLLATQPRRKKLFFEPDSRAISPVALRALVDALTREQWTTWAGVEPDALDQELWGILEAERR
jgi:hypothetical protein